MKENVNFSHKGNHPENSNRIKGINDKRNIINDNQTKTYIRSIV